MDKNIKKVFIQGTIKPVWIKEKQHKRGVKTPTSYRYGKHWESSSGVNVEFLKYLYNKGINPNSIDFSKKGYQQGIYIY